MSTILFITIVSYMALPGTRTEEIWLPETFDMVGEVEDIELSGTMYFITFDEYQQRFAENEHTISWIRPNGQIDSGEIYYLTKSDDHSYATTKQAMPRDGWRILTALTSINISNTSTIETSYQPHYILIVLMSILGIIILAPSWAWAMH